MTKSPLAEVFGFPTNATEENAVRHQRNRLCPFHNGVPNCTKYSAIDPIGVCSIYIRDRPVVICPVRFREDWIIAQDAAKFLFPDDAKWTAIPEVKLSDANGKLVGKMDFVLVSYDDNGLITNYGALEAQAVYISGNVGKLFKGYIDNPKVFENEDWSKLFDLPRSDPLSARKRLIPQLIVKSKILHRWGKKMVVAVDTDFFNSLPTMDAYPASTADLAWNVYTLTSDPESNRLKLTKSSELLTDLRYATSLMTDPPIGDEDSFRKALQLKLTAKLTNATANGTNTNE